MEDFMLITKSVRSEMKGSGSIEIPLKYELNQNYPNPFNPATTIYYSIPLTGIVKLKVYDITGRDIASCK
ncbi:MAG: T9SS type A sorting domain-containing protein [Ignavibacteria bacterium]|nr:T9SS type A sorting domain-containing protein [Ignavibacteria bacterium]